MSGYNPPVRTVFDNGMELFSMANEMLSASQVGFTLGCRNDPARLSGMVHIIEHLWCRGASETAIADVTKRCPDRPTPVSERTADLLYRKYFGGSNGPGINVYTVHSHVGFGHQDLFRGRYLPEVFSAMAGLVRDSLYDARDLRYRHEAIMSPRAFAIERAAVLHETAENDEDPSMAGHRAALKALYARNPARLYGDSDPEQLLAVKLGTVKLWAQQHLVPEKLRVIILGPSRNAAVRLVREAGLNALPAWPSAKWEYDRSDDVPVLTGIVHQDIPGTGKMSHVYILWPTETYNSPDAYALEVLAGVMKDRIEHQLREHLHAVYHPSVEWDSTSTHGYLCLAFSTLKRAEECDRVITRALDVVEEIKNDRSERLTEEVEAGRFFLANTYLEEYRFTPGAFADRMMEALANGDPELRRFNRYYQDMLRVSPVRVRNAAKKYLHRDRFVRTVVRPVP